MQTLKTKNLTWYHFSNPTPADLKWIRENFKIHPLAFQELSRPTMRPRVDNYHDHLYVVLHFPIFEAKERKTYAREVDFILNTRELVTVSFGALQPLEELFQKCTDESACEDIFASKTVGHLFFHVVRELYRFALRELDHIQENIDDMEERVFSTEHEEEALIEDLSIIRRDVIDFRRVLKPQQGTLESLMPELIGLYGAGMKPFSEVLIAEYTKVWNLLENSKEAIDAIYDNNVTVLNIKQNEAMRILSIMAFVTFPLMLFSALFSMETVHTPLIGTKNDFWIIIGIMAIAVTGMVLYFRKKRWL